MGDLGSIDLLTRLTELAFKFGPFLFAIVTLLYVTKRANDYYLKVAIRQDPPPRPEELRARRLIYYSTWIVAFLLVGVSVAWWLMSNVPQKRDFVQFTILKIDSGVEILKARSEDVYLRTILFQGPRTNDDQQRLLEDYYFLVPITGILEGDQKIAINYINTPIEVEDDLWMNLRDINKKTYRIVVEPPYARLEEVKYEPD